MSTRSGVFELYFQLMENIVMASLNYGHQSGYQSIALPAMGTGNLHFPRDVVANTMFDTVIEFSRVNPNTTLKDVRFVLFNKDQPTIDVSDLLPTAYRVQRKAVFSVC